MFPGKYLYQNSILRVSMDIKFSAPLKSIRLTFATNDSHGAGNVNNATDIKLNAYMGSTSTSPVGTATARGTFTSESFAEGTLSFNSAQSFDLVRLELAIVPQGATAFMIDNITVTTA
jgi:cellulase/cellobiase CelA1